MSSKTESKKESSSSKTESKKEESSSSKTESKKEETSSKTESVEEESSQVQEISSHADRPVLHQHHGSQCKPGHPGSPATGGSDDCMSGEHCSCSGVPQRYGRLGHHRQAQ